MTFDVEVDGRRHQVDVVRTATGEQVSIDGRSFSSHVEGTGSFWSLLIDRGGSAGVARSYEVGIEPAPDRETLVVSIEGYVVAVRLVDRRRSRARSAGAHATAGVQEVRAPMPGRIVRVLVAAGDNVAPRQPLVVVEAMKMENELCAQAAGMVTEVRVQAGSTVEAGALLLNITS